MVATASPSRPGLRRFSTPKRKLALRRHHHVLSYHISPLLRYKLKGNTRRGGKRPNTLRQLSRHRIVCKPFHVVPTPDSVCDEVVLGRTVSTDSYFNSSGASLLGSECSSLHLFGAEGTSVGGNSDSNHGCSSLVRQGSIRYIGDPELTPSQQTPAEVVHDEGSGWGRSWTEDSEMASLTALHSADTGCSNVRLSTSSSDSTIATPGLPSASLGDSGDADCSDDDSVLSDASDASSGISGESESDQEPEPEERREQGMTFTELLQHLEAAGHAMNPSSVYLSPSMRVAPTIIRHKRPPILSSFDLPGIAKFVQARPSCKIIVLTGAGISVAAGIPDFRSEGTGLYSRLEEYNLPEPSAVFDLDYFPDHPEPFFTLAKELWPGNYAPTLVHHFITMLHEKGLLLRNYTQNIDGLELVAGMPREALVEVHGTFATARCLGCRREYSSEYVKSLVFADQIPRCGCGHLIKPDIVFFGEQLPERFFGMVNQDMHQADLVIVIGTSLQVAPFSSLPERCQEEVPRLLMNNEVVGEAHAGRPAGFDFSSDWNYRDVKAIGDCQQGVVELAALLGFKDALLARHEEASKLAPPAPPTPAQFKPSWLLRRQEQLNDPSESDASVGASSYSAACRSDDEAC